MIMACLVCSFDREIVRLAPNSFSADVIMLRLAVLRFKREISKNYLLSQISIIFVTTKR